MKYDFNTDQGIRCLTADEAARIAGQDPDHHQRGLHGAIHRGELPVADAPGYGFDPFAPSDSTAPGAPGA